MDVSSVSCRGQAVVRMWVEVGELVDAIQHIGDELFEVYPRRNPHLSPKLPCHGFGQLQDIPIVDNSRHTVRRGALLYIGVASPTSDFAEFLKIKCGEPDLNRSRVVKTGVGGEVNMETLGQRLKDVVPLEGPRKTLPCR